jgi:hypothetical protein
VRVQLDWFDEKLAARLADLEAGRIAPAATRDAATGPLTGLLAGPATTAAPGSRR